MLVENGDRLFVPDFDDRLPGELLVKVKGGGNIRTVGSMETGSIASSRNLKGVRAEIDEFNRVLSELPPLSIIRLHGPFRTTISAQEITDQDLASTYRLRFRNADIDLDSIEKQLREVPAVLNTSPNRIRFAFSPVIPNDPHYSLQWGLDKINCPEAWKQTKGSASVVVAIVDSGVDRNHDDLKAQLLPGCNMVNIIGQSADKGWRWEGRYRSRDANPQDEVGHGTHVAGIAAAMTNNGVGVAGVTWFCKIMPVRVLARMVRIVDGAFKASGIASDIAAGIIWAADNGAHIINLSFGGHQDTFVEEDAVKHAIDKGCLVVAAMGNDGNNFPAFPAAFPDVVAVGAIDRSNQRPSWSNTGSHISLVAPGVDIFSSDLPNTYTSKNGTSMAAPHVSGVAALVKSCNPELTAAEIAQILQETALNICNEPSDPIPNEEYGYGLVDAHAAVKLAYSKIGS